MTVNVTITDVNNNPITVVDASAIGAYRVNIAYSCSIEDCTNAQVQIAAPPTDPYSGAWRKETAISYTPPFNPAPALQGSMGAGYTINLGTVTAGTNGLIRLDYTVGTQSSRISAGNFFPDGSPITPTVTMTSSNAPTVSGSASATWKSYIGTPSLTINTSPSGRISTDSELTVNASSGSGCWRIFNGVLRSIPWMLCGNSGQMTVQLPAKADYVAGSGGSYNAATHSVTLTSGPGAYQAIGGGFRVVFPSADYPTTGDGCLAEETFTVRDATYTYLDGTTKATNPTTAPARVTVGNCAPFAKASVGKTSRVVGGNFTSASWAIPLTPAGAYSVRWEVTANNQANVPGVATIVDNALDQDDLPVTLISVAAGGPATIQYELDDGTTGTATSVTSLSAPAGRHFAEVTATSTTLAGPNVKDTDTGGTPFTLYFTAALRETATPGTRTNTATATMSYPDYPALGTITATGSPASRTVTLVAQATPQFTINASNLAAAVTGGGNLLVGGEVTWRGTGSGTNMTSADSWTPQYVFVAPAGWDIKAGTAALATSVSGATFSYQSVSYGGQTRDAVIVTWPEAVPGNGTLTLPELSVKATPTGDAAAGTNTAHFFVGDATNAVAPVYGNARTVDTTDVDLDGATTDVFSRGSGAIAVQASPLIGITKEICIPDAGAADGCDWVPNPPVPVGVQPDASSIRYRVTLTNTGNAPLSNLVAYDVLPYIGDTGTTTATANTPRGSTVKEELSSVSNVSAGVTLAYSTSTNPSRPEVYSGPATGGWTAPLAGASAIRATVASLAAKQSVSFEYLAALVGGSADQIACNTVAANAPSLAAIESAPVCASTQEGDLRIETANRFPLQEGRVGVVPFVVTNGGGSQLASGTVTLSVPEGLSLANLNIAGWDCTAPETAGPVDVECIPVNPDGTQRSLVRDTPETIALEVIPAEGTGELCIEGSVVGLIYDPELDNNETASCAALYSGEDLLEISKTDGVATAAPGDTLTYTLTIANNLVAEGVTGAVITDSLPGNVTFVSASDGGTLSGAAPNGTGGTVTWPAVDLVAAGTPTAGGSDGDGAAGSSLTRSVTVRVVPTAVGEVVNEADVTAPDPADPAAELADDASDTDDLQRLSLTKSSDAAPAGVRTGDVVTYTVTLENDGTADYTAGNPARIVDDLADVLDDATFVNASAEIRIDGGPASDVDDPANGQLTWSGALDAGSVAVLTYQVTVGAGAPGDVLTNTAYAAGAASSCTDGLTPANASCDTVTTQFAPTLAKLVTSSTHNDDGTWTIVYSVVVTNASPTAASTYTLTDALAFGSGIAVTSAAVTSAPAGVTPAAWTGSGAIASAVAIPANTQHTYQLTVVANAGTTGGTPAAVCAPGVAGGFANRATLATTDGRSAMAEACASPFEPTVDKTVTPATQLPDGRWNVVYTVTVSNPHPAALPYTLDDVLDIPAGITVDDITVTGPEGAPLNRAFDGAADTALLTGVDRIPAGTSAAPATRVYTVTLLVDASLAGNASVAEVTCPPAGTGGYRNAVTLRAGSSSTVLDSAEACTNATPQPMPTITKDVVSSSVDGDGDWVVEYEIAVTNEHAQYSTRYSLADELRFAAGSTVEAADVTSTDAAVSPAWNGGSDPTVASNVALPAATTHRYTVAVTVDPGTVDPESALADCRVDAGETGTGFRNVATVVAGVESAFADACEPFTDPSVVKTTTGAPTQDPTTGIWTLTYDLTVSNRSTTVDEPIAYELSDELGFPADVEIVDVEATAPAGGTVNPDFDGVDDTDLGSGAIGAAPDNTTPATQVFTVTVQFTVPAGLDTGAVCDPAQGAGGLRNEAEVAVGDRVSGSVACADLPDVPAPGLTKTVASQEQLPNGTWEVVYAITVANPSPTAASRYSLEDQFAFGLGIDLVGEPEVTAPGGIDVNDDFDGSLETTISEDILLPAAGSHTYEVRAVIDSGAVTADDRAGDCTFDGGEAGTGFANIAWVDTGAVIGDASVCAQAWDPGVSKELNGVPVQQPDGSWLLSYTMTVTNPSDVPLSYGLVDELDFPAGTVVTVEAAQSRPGGPSVNPDWDGETELQLVANGTALPPNAIHIFDVTVRALLPEDQDSQPGGWGNTATVESGVDGVIATDATATADILVPELVITKAATAEDPVLRIGDTVTYDVTIENTGEGDFTALFPAIVWDDLTDVLDDGELTAGPTATPEVGAIVPVGDRYRWSAALQSGESVTLAYTVTIRGGGNAELVNVAFTSIAAITDPPTPALDECTGDGCSSTVTAMPALDVEKRVSAATTTRGDVVEYTVRVTNTGGVDLTEADPARMSDDLRDVLDDASYNGDVRATSGTASLAGSTLNWEGALPAGATATITYSVTVDGDAPDGSELRNVAVTDPTLATLAVDDDDATPGSAATLTTVMALAVTGSGAVRLAVVVAIMLLIAGAVLLRRRRAAVA